MDLARLEVQRQALEQNLHKLRASLKHWQTYSAELEGLKEEIESAGADPNLEVISKTYGGQLVNENEIRDLAGLAGTTPRSAPQILNMVSRRQEYVQKNIDTIQKQFFEGESKLEELDFAAISANRDHGPGGLPLTEIHEELDDEGNVISSKVSQPEAQTTRLVDALRKAGLSEHDIDSEIPADASLAEHDTAAVKTTPVPPPALVHRESKTTGGLSKTNSNDSHKSDSDTPARLPLRKKSVSFSADTKLAPEPVRSESEEGRKSVSFNEKVAVMPAAPPPDPRSVSFSPKVEEIPAELAQKVEKPNSMDFRKSLKGYTFKPGEKIAELDDETLEVSRFHTMMPDEESEEDAATRREMLEYHLNEVGHVVAQMDLDPEDYEMDEDDVSDFTSSEHPDDDTPYTSGLSDSDAESEDEYGRTKRRVISDDYHKEMQELQRRLIGNLGPTPSAKAVSDLDPEVDPQDVHRLVIQEQESVDSSGNGNKNSGKKRVSFAEALKVADEPNKAQKVGNSNDPENLAPMADAGAERETLMKPTSLSSSGTPRKPPAFGASRPYALDGPNPPTDSIVADQLFERPTRSKSATAPDQDGLDPITQRRELAAEYYRRRNDIIRQQGGFKNASVNDEDDVGEGPLMEERDGKVKKVSKFKAARIRS